MENNSEELKCSICSDPIKPNQLTGWKWGNNAEPINNGRCCDTCDMTVVIPKRIKSLREGKNFQ